MKQLFFDETGKISMKRLCGLLCTIALCITMYCSLYSNSTISPSSTLIDAVALLAFGCLGLSSIDKIWGKNQKNGDNGTQL